MSARTGRAARSGPDGAAILWRGLRLEGHECGRVYRSGSEWNLAGTAVFRFERRPCRIDYRVLCDAAWRTRFAQVSGWLGARLIDLELRVGSGGRWRLNGTPQPRVAGCIDLDLNFSPSTNLIPIRRLGLAVGGAAEVTSAWLRFPSFRLQPLAQVYRRLGRSTYRYESGGGRFVSDLRVSDRGLVTSYPGIWEAEALA